jgi:type I restriction enzyme S subunit
MVGHGWRRLALGEFLTESRQRVAVSVDGVYPMCGVYGFGRGVLFRDAVRGGDMSTPYLYRIFTGQIIYSRLKAFEGAFALVPPEAEGRYVSNEFPTFDVDEDHALPAFIAHVLARQQTWTELAERITGVGARRERLQVKEFLEFEIALPPVDEQKRIVAALHAAGDVVAASKAEAEAARALAVAIHERPFKETGWRRVKLAAVARLDVERMSVVAEDEYSVAGVLIAGRGLFWRETIKGSATNYEKLHRLRAGQLVYRKLTAWEGPITVVPPEFDGAFVSPEFPTFTLDRSQLLPEFMRFTCRQPSFHKEMRARSTGTAERRNRLKPADLLDVEIDLPPLEEQQRVAAAISVEAALLHEAEMAVAVAAATREALLT